MTSNKSDVDLSLGLDRAELGQGPETKGADLRPQIDPSDHCQVSARQAIREILPTVFSHPRDGFRKIKAVAKEKKSTGTDTSTEQDIPVLAPAPPYAIGDERLEHELEPRRKFPPVKDFVYSPISALKTVAKDQGGDGFAAHVMKSEVSHGESVKLLQQESKLNQASPEENAAEAQTLKQMNSARQDAFVRWTVDRHIRRVAVLRIVAPPPQTTPNTASWQSWKPYLQRRLQYYIDRCGEQHIVVAPEEKADPTQELLISSLERVVIVSASFQSFVMRMRDISHWKNPRSSASCMLLYFVLLFATQITRMTILFVLASIVHRRWHPPDLTGLRTAVLRSEDRDETVRTLAELILQHGNRGWVDHLVAQTGPDVLRLTERVADLLEQIQNFYEWRDPARTRALLYKLSGFWLLITFTPTWLLVQMSFFIFGVSFFILTPIGYHYPKYELLTSPMTWMMWGIPTHADWAIARLQAEAAPRIQSNPEKPGPESSPEKESGAGVIGRYACTNGLLKVTTRLVCFIPGTSSLEGWNLSYDELTAMHKVEENTRTTESRGVAFVTASGGRHVVLDLAVRDEIFSQILGYSSLKWKKIE